MLKIAVNDSSKVNITTKFLIGHKTTDTPNYHIYLHSSLTRFVQQVDQGLVLNPVQLNQNITFLTLTSQLYLTVDPLPKFILEIKTCYPQLCKLRSELRILKI